MGQRQAALPGEQRTSKSGTSRRKAGNHSVHGGKDFLRAFEEREYVKFKRRDDRKRT